MLQPVVELCTYARSLLFFVVDSVCLYVRPCVHLSVTDKLQIASSFSFLGGIEPLFGRQFFMWHSTKLFFFDF